MLSNCVAPKVHAKLSNGSDAFLSSEAEIPQRKTTNEVDKACIIWEVYEGHNYTSYKTTITLALISAAVAKQCRHLRNAAFNAL